MSRVIAQSIFTETTERRSWQSYVASTGVHVALVAALAILTVPTVEKIAEQQHTVLIAPVIPQFKPKVIQRPVYKKVVLNEPVKPVIQPKKFVPPPVVKPPEPQHVEIAKAPEIKAPEVHAPEIKTEMPAPPKPPVKVGVFNSQELARGPKVPNQVKTGGFGDPNGVRPSDNSQSGHMMLARVGGFDLPQGSGNTGGGGHAMSGGVRAAGFGSMGDPNGVPGGTGVHGTARVGSFGDGTAARGGLGPQVTSTAPAATPIEILYKPKPVYTAEARQLGIEGQVQVEVTFLANGTIRVIRVLHGLGHGLDEAALQAASQVRFRPATKGGVPVDTNATINITFQLT